MQELCLFQLHPLFAMLEKLQPALSMLSHANPPRHLDCHCHTKRKLCGKALLTIPLVRH